MAQKAAHYAPTGKNPQSSRGHTAFVIEVQMTDGHRSNFVVLDLAGSEGINAITPSFIKNVGEATAKVRLLEGGAINYSLQQIQAILKEVGSKSGVSKVQGNGLRKLLWPFLQRENSPMVMVLFTLSPSEANLDATRSTFRVAHTMAGLKIKPIRVTVDKSKDEIIRELKKTIRAQEWKISKLRSEIEMLKDGVDDEELEDSTYIPATKLQRTLSQQDTEANAEEKEELIEYNVKDLMQHKTALVSMKRQMTTVLQDQGGDTDELLVQELKDIDDEIASTESNIHRMKNLEVQMTQAIAMDVRSNSVINKRTSEKQFGEFVRVKKVDLMLLKEQLDKLSQCMQQKKENTKRRNEELMAFVDKLQSEQKELLSDLDAKSAA